MPYSKEELEREALLLSVHERAELVYSLIRSLDKEEDPDAKQLWDEEIQRRLQSIEDGTAQWITHDESKAQAQQALRDMK